ncbi:MAG: proline--tRNA ligase [Patescibacteria group bacterium]|nr:proline--tRNA ligase [Patescibacteria group bacterium]
MRYSKLFGRTRKEVPRDTKLKSHQLLTQAGFINQTAAGLYSFLPLGFKVLSKVDIIIKEELSKEGVQHLLMPYVSPANLWKESGRWQKMDDILAKFTSKRGQDLLLSPTHEEIVTDLVRKYVYSYKDLPLILNQNQFKFRDEIRVFGGLIRSREFLMQDAYSMDKDKKGMDKSFDAVVRAYQAIFKRVGIEALEVEADSGTMGGSDSHEFMAITGEGEDVILECDKCGYKANIEKAEFVREKKNPKEKIKQFKIIDQPEWVCTNEDNVKHYKKPTWRYLKNVVYKDEKGRIIIASLRGDQEVNEFKLVRAVKADFLEPATDEDLEKMGTKSGWVHSWGHKGVIYVGDLGLKMVRNFIGGKKEKTTDSSNVNYGRDFKYRKAADIVNAKQGDGCVKCKGGKLKEVRGIEVGHAFKLGPCYSESMKAEYLDSKGKLQSIQMGCYGVGISRLVAVIAEINRDKDGLIWPETVAPYRYYLLGLDLDDKKVKSWAEKVYQYLLDKNEEVLFDDREGASPGEKFNDADLLGIPWRLVVGKKATAVKKVELKGRQEKSGRMVELKIL